MLQNMATEPTQATLRDLGIPADAYYSSAAQYINQYVYQIEGQLPKSDARLWKNARRGAPRNTAIPSRSGALPLRKEKNSIDDDAHPNAKNKLRRPDDAQRTHTIATETGDIKGVLVEWAEVRLSDYCSQTLLTIQISTNSMRQLIDGKIESRQ